jgi:hypothetical protein
MSNHRPMPRCGAGDDNKTKEVRVMEIAQAGAGLRVGAAAFLLFAICVAAIAPADAQQNWHKQVESSIADVTGPEQVKCPELYETTQTRCQFEGGPACLMRRAVEAAKRGDCARAIWFTEITKCTDPAAQREIKDAGATAVCEYLKSR